MALHSIRNVAFCWSTQLTQSNLERESQKHKYPNLTLLLPASLLLVTFTGQTQAEATFSELGSTKYVEMAVMLGVML